MRPDEYDQLIEDPTGYLLNVWLPRVAAPLVRPGQGVTPEHNLSLIKGAMAMMQFFQDLGLQEQWLRNEAGTVPAIAGMLRAPLDILADKLRGYLGLLEDLRTQPQKGAGRLRGADAALDALRPRHGGSRPECAHRVLDASRMRAVHFAAPVRRKSSGQR